MSQILNDLLGVLCLAGSRLTPAKRGKKVLRGEMAKSRSQRTLHRPQLQLGVNEGPNPGGRKREDAGKCEAPESSLWLLPMALWRPDNKQDICTHCLPWSLGSPCVQKSPASVLGSC